VKTTNAKSRQFVQNLKPFIANNLSARIEQGKFNLYVIYSYGWYPLFAYDYNSNTWFENAEKYSVSTSKQRGQCHPQVKTIEISHASMKDLIQGR